MAEDRLHAMRHSLAHILAGAIVELWPKTRFGVGPVIENGFYYDVDTGTPLKPEDLEKIEAKMRAIIKADHPFERSEMPIAKAVEWARQSGQTFKEELLSDLAKHGTTSAKDIASETLGVDSTTHEKITTVGFYKSGDFTDLCRGPHVESTGKVGAFKLTKLAGAYWRGKDTNPQLQRVYGVAFETEKELRAYFAMLEEAQKRDHRKLGTELDLFVFSDLVGSGLPLWTPRGTIMRRELDRFVQEMRSEYGFQEVTIPHITKKDLYVKSGHWDKFKDELFRIETREGHEFAMKPMNCPHHAQIYASRPRSYRDLPIRYRETTMVYRDEQSGELSGLSRVRSITQDDAHVFCRQNQIKDEMLQVWDIVERFWGAFGIQLQVRLSTHDPDDMSGYLGDVTAWEAAVQQLKSVIKLKKVDYIDGVGEAAFYGPKIDFLGRDVLGREFQASTIQLDFGQPEGFDLTVTNEKSEEERIVMIHCAIAGSLERTMVLLIEHYGGRFPVWLAPEQVRLATINDTEGLAQYAENLAEWLGKEGIRATVDLSNESVGRKIRAAELMKVPYTIVIGDREVKADRVTPRSRQDLEELGEVGMDDLVKRLKGMIDQRV